MTKVFKYGVLVVLFSCILVFSSSSPSIANTPPHTPVKGFYIGMSKTEADEKMEQHLTTFKKLYPTLHPDIYELKEGTVARRALILDIDNLNKTSQKHNIVVELVLKNDRVTNIRMNPPLFGITKKLTMSETESFVKQAQHIYGFVFKKGKGTNDENIAWFSFALEKGHMASIFFNEDGWFFLISKSGPLYNADNFDFENKLEENMD